jgi:beta-glucosidase
MGSEAGNIFADLLVGDAVPDGKLTVTWPRTVGQEPLFYNTNNSQIPDQRDSFYWDVPSTPQYPFGFGLSYTAFDIDNLAIASPTLAGNGTLKAMVRVRNTGKYRGAEVVELYTHQRSGSASRPVRELKAFAKVTLDPGESRTVELSMPATELEFWSPSLHRTVLEPGTFDLWVGDSSAATLHATFRLTASGSVARLR